MCEICSEIQPAKLTNRREGTYEEVLIITELIIYSTKYRVSDWSMMNA